MLLNDNTFTLLYFRVIWNRCLLLRLSAEKATYQNRETDSVNNFLFKKFTLFCRKET